MAERKLKLIPINPFTERQGQILELRAQGLFNKEIAKRLGIAEQTVKNHISGDPAGRGRQKLGVLGVIKNASGKRPSNRNWIAPLIGDVLLFSEDK